MVECAIQTAGSHLVEWSALAILISLHGCLELFYFYAVLIVQDHT